MPSFVADLTFVTVDAVGPPAPEREGTGERSATANGVSEEDSTRGKTLENRQMRRKTK